MNEELYGIFFRDQDATEYLVAVEEDHGVAVEQAQEMDDHTYRRALEDGGEGVSDDWEDFDGMHYVESVSSELARDARAELERGFAVRVG